MQNLLISVVPTSLLICLLKSKHLYLKTCEHLESDLETIWSEVFLENDYIAKIILTDKPHPFLDIITTPVFKLQHLLKFQRNPCFNIFTWVAAAT